jgi:hypothetical protein
LSTACSEPQVRNLANALRQRAAADPLGAYQEIFGLGEARGEANVTLRLLTRRCGPLTGATTARPARLPGPDRPSQLARSAHLTSVH